MDARQETVGLLNKIWLKLQSLPSAHPLELAGFFILLIFIFTVILMAVLTCVSRSCCCRCCPCCKPKQDGPNV
ncbi:hypothetical protein ATANTOWER_010258 [Ataeniobius toweri]|uniref:Small integral membrane protein 5 n=1 Tax=Ataeniobius toweri TaxID=208326 RepID=A0ABU7AYI1_9TELE|nr:hypothetical protein [Ataeniobius toweri]